MKTKWEKLYSDMVIDLQYSGVTDQPEVRQIQHGYETALQYWRKIKALFLEGPVCSMEEEIEFFKMVKPRFCSYIEYFLCRHQAVMFNPELYSSSVAYWEEESRRYPRFCNKHTDFIRYYESLATHQDEIYFTRKANSKSVPPQEKMYEDEDCRSSYDHVIRGLMAKSMYHEYALQRLANYTVVTGAGTI